MIRDMLIVWMCLSATISVFTMVGSIVEWLFSEDKSLRNKIKYKHLLIIFILPGAIIVFLTIVLLFSIVFVCFKMEYILNKKIF